MGTIGGPTYPIAIGGTFAKRVQDFSADKGKPLETVFEMGNVTPVGNESGEATYTASLSWFPIDNEIEQLLAGLPVNPATTVSLKELIEALGVLVQSKVDGLNAAKVSSLEYSVRVGGDFTGSVQLKGNGWNNGLSTLVATPPAGQSVFKAKNVAVVMGATRAVRCASVSFRANVPTEDLYELSNEDPFEQSADSPEITAEIEWWESDVKAGNVEPSPQAPIDIIVGVGGSAKRITLKAMSWERTGVKGRVKGKATRTYHYKSGGHQATSGVLFDTADQAATVGTPVANPVSPQVAGTPVTLTSTVTDADTIFKVEFWDGTVKLGEDFTPTTNDYSIVWNASGVGVHNIVARCVDLYGTKTNSTALVFTVT